jgi:DNA-binding MarR family transcriptional regulator
MTQAGMNDLSGAVRELYMAIERFDATAAHRLGVDRSGLRAVNAMERGGISPGELSEHLGLTTGAVTALLDRMEKAGHVERHIVPGDARRREADLSKSTRRNAHTVYGLLGHAIASGLSAFPDPQRKVILKGLFTLATAFNEAAEKNSNVV